MTMAKIITTMIPAAFYMLLSTPLHAEYSNVYSGTPISTVIRVTFPYASTTFQPPAEVAEMLADAKEASIIYVSGRTSTTYPSARDEALAFARAASARKYLIDRGVSPLKIMINYASAMDYAVDNSTPEGMRENQRVDIEMVYVPLY